jgi:hypothetical protein
LLSEEQEASEPQTTDTEDIQNRTMHPFCGWAGNLGASNETGNLGGGLQAEKQRFRGSGQEDVAQGNGRGGGVQKFAE